MRKNVSANIWKFAKRQWLILLCQCTKIKKWRFEANWSVIRLDVLWPRNLTAKAVFLNSFPSTYRIHTHNLNFKCHVQSSDSYICCVRAKPLQRKTTTTSEPIPHIHVLLLTTLTLTFLNAKRAQKHKIVLNATYISLMAAHVLDMIFQTKMTNLH